MKRATMDANTAVATVAYPLNEVCAIYPITPSSPMAELADSWAAAGRRNLWGEIPLVQEMQAEGGAAGTVHGALQSGALTTTFTASQGLMLMLPNMYKIAGELSPTVFHVAARSLATSALSIFGDHSDVMGARQCGFAMLASASVQEAHDMALVTQVATLASRVPFMHFFDGFRTSHELNTIELLDDAVLRAMIDDDHVRQHRERALDPEQPFIRGTAQNPDTFFQSREAVNPYYKAVPGIVEQALDEFGKRVGREYRLVEYAGADDPDQLLILMGSGAETARETVKALAEGGARVGSLLIRLYRPFPCETLLDCIPDSVRKIAVLDRTKEPGACGEPLYQDVVATLARALATGRRATMPQVVGGRYGLSSKDFTPAMVKAVFDELNREQPCHGFTVGIEDDIGGYSLAVDSQFSITRDDTRQAVFYGLGADGTVGANKNSVKIIGEDTDLFAQGYFVYDSHKSGAQTVSHLRFGSNPIRAPYLIRHADFIACHKFDFLERQDVLECAREGATFLLNAPFEAGELWPQLPASVQHTIIDKQLQLYVIDASRAARELGLGVRINTILQTCFFALADILPRDAAITHIKEAIRKSYGSKGERIVRMNFTAVDGALERLQEVPVPSSAGDVSADVPPLVPADAPPFVREVTARMFAAQGDSIPVSKVPVDGTFPSGTSQYEKRNVSDIVPEWRADLCIQCGQCSFVCPHSVIRARYFDTRLDKQAPEGFQSAPINTRGYPDTRFTLQIHVEDCTGCGLCVQVCPAHSPIEPDTRAINMRSKAPTFDRDVANIRWFKQIPVNDRSMVDFGNVRGVQFLEPLFEFPGACAGCGETPYLKLMSQLFGDRAQIANATGCSSIYGGNTPVTPWSTNHEGRGPAWSNSLFEDNAEFGLGFRLAADQHVSLARQLLEKLRPQLEGMPFGDVAEPSGAQRECSSDGRLERSTLDALLNAPQILESDIRKQRQRVARLKSVLESIVAGEAENVNGTNGKDRASSENCATSELAGDAANLLSVVDHLVRRSVWIVGGDGWAYDIGYGGLDHVLAQDRNINVLVMDTEVYSNTGGQSSKATPLGAVAKFAAAGKRTPRKDLGMLAVSYGHIYVAQVAMGADPQQTLQAFREAEAYDGPSLILAYSHCIAHGIDMRKGLDQQRLAVASAYWPLFRYNPNLRSVGENPFSLDSQRPSLPLKDYAYNELRYRSLSLTDPDTARELLRAAERWVHEKYMQYEDLATRDGSRFTLAPIEEEHA